MDESTARQNALVVAAKNAAEKGDGDAVLKATAGISAGTARDNLCVNGSQILTKLGETAIATNIANEIENDTSRNNVLASIATNEGSE